jgi:CRISPR-associated protein Csd1
MLLRRLEEYATRRQLPPPLYDELPVRYIVELDAEGDLLNPEPNDTADSASRETRRGVRRLAPNVQRSVGIKPLLLADKADYTLAYAGEGSKPDRVRAVHAAYMEQLERCAEVTQEPDVGAVLRFLRDSPLEKLKLREDFDPGEKITFRVEGRFPIELEAVQAFWAAENTDPGAPVMQCLVCGEERPVLERLQGKIKGVPGAQAAGASIISANAEAFLSYGLKASLIAPTCAISGERFTKAANELLASRESRINLAGSAFISWTREEVGFNVVSYLDDPQPQQVRELYATVYSGKRLPRVDEMAFYSLALSGSSGRIVVRDWIDATVGEVKERLTRWFERQRIVGPWGEEDDRPLGLRDLASATVRDLKDLPAPTSRALLRGALTGTPLPADLMYQAVRRNRAERSVVPARTASRYAHKRMALIKLVVASRNTQEEGEYMVRLDPENTNPAYRCGRLLAALEEAQRLAIPGLNATIVDRYYGTASSAPASVYGTLLDGARSHLSKLKRDRPAAHLALQRRIEEIMGGISADGGFPRTLSLEQQAMFALGYYHQRAYDRAQMVEAKRRKAEGAPMEPEHALAENLEQVETEQATSS